MSLLPLKLGVQEIFTTREVLVITVTFAGGLGTATKSKIKLNE